MRGLILAALFAMPALANGVTPVAVIERGSVIEGLDLMAAAQTPGAIPASDVIGKEAARRLVPGRAIRAADVREVRAVERGEDITIVFAAGALEISAQGRALSGGGMGDSVRVQSADSRTPLSATITGPGRVTLN
ncbi:MAG: flagellar basal body P-ring formation chaperone FlgA [Pacificimonas sp.]